MIKTLKNHVSTFFSVQQVIFLGLDLKVSFHPLFFNLSFSRSIPPTLFVSISVSISFPRTLLLHLYLCSLATYVSLPSFSLAVYANAFVCSSISFFLCWSISLSCYFRCQWIFMGNLFIRKKTKTSFQTHLKNWRKF